MRKHNIFDVIGMAFQKWWYNFIIVLPFIFSLIASIISILLIFFIFVFLFKIISPGILESFITFIRGENIESMSNLITPTLAIYIILAAIISVLVLELIKAYFYSGAIVMASDIVKGKKTNLRVMNKAGKRFLWRYFFVKLIISVGIIIWLFIFLLPFILTEKFSLLWILFISVIPLAFIYVLFLLPEYFVVLDNVGVWDAIKRSIGVVKANYWAMLGLGLLFILMSAVVGFIPWVGSLLSLIIIAPCQTIAFIIFIFERAKH